MNSFERYHAVLERQPADFLPRTPILMQYAAEHIGTDYAAFSSDYKVLVEANEKCSVDFGFDQLSCISDPYRETSGFGSKISYHKDGPPRSTHPLENSKSLAILQKPDPLQSKRMLDRIMAVRVFKKDYFQKYSILGWIEGPAAEAANLRGIINFLMDLIEDEEFAIDLMDLCTQVSIDFALAQVNAGADTIGIGDAIASQISPDIYESLIQPREKKIINEIKKTGAKVKLHICGNITHLLPAIGDLGVDILDVDYMVDMKMARKVIGDKVVLSGNLDPVSGIKNSSPKIINDKIKRIYESVGNPYMVNAGCEIPSGTPLENLKAMCEEIPYQH
jgi:MtaA/CmuA family methyltransferase